ncbi:biotin-dependent carboxyltransferase family protein [Terribacillus saccharophilus]|uniref:KipI antagonist n=1 Tax=Terribacillus saccharophilus TaxID=361277 RepID=A0ABX4GUY7_9BACI|nr:biotin-dependent carboxyltransferase family protein [Terribacillus saccharophilus]PAD34363.1 KipI antagonist [Terribacillus saccharophilus]PAD94941.1 KipI antagonist [Terribacillus saccharophilus]PAD98690.1 KipI antagonist [Terribacillus saccharophilus]
MSSKLFQVIKPGLMTTFQDLGRTGYQEYGVVVAGAMDDFSLQIANLLVGNKRDEAGLEVTMMGPVLKVLEDAVIAITGGNLSPRVNGQPAPMWKSFAVKEGQLIEFGQPLEGIRSYISVAGGFDLPAVMGSNSTYLKARIGGLNGRALEKEDILYGTENPYAVTGRSLHYDEIPKYKKEVTVRVVLGPHQDAFTEEAIKNFLSSNYEITPQSDRMGYRLKGPELTHKTTADIISEAIPLGGIQVPANGQPIILMADRQTTGGYTRIATAIAVDIPMLAQAAPGAVIRFEEVAVEEAQELYQERASLLQILDKISK